MTISGKTKPILSSWPEHTDDEHVLLNTDALLTVCEPTEQIRDAYLKKINKTLKDFEEAPAPVLLNEEESVPEPTDDTDDYEPEYLEEPLY